MRRLGVVLAGLLLLGAAGPILVGSFTGIGGGANSVQVDCTASATDSTCAGHSADATAANTVAVGDDAQATAANCTVVGSNASCTNSGSTLYGASTSSQAGGNSLFGYSANSGNGSDDNTGVGVAAFFADNVDKGTCVGRNCACQASGQIALGYGATGGSGADSICIGRNCGTSTFANCFAVGLSAACAAANDFQAGTAAQPLNYKGYGTITSASTDTLGWSVVVGANTACTTTCTSACMGGQDTDAATKPIVDCASATADRCFCAGAN